MRIDHDWEADAVYVYLSEGTVEDTRIFDDCRFVHFDEVGNVRGVEFLNVSAGVKIADLPVDAHALQAVLRAHHIAVLDVPSVHCNGLEMSLGATVGTALMDAASVLTTDFPIASLPYTVGIRPERLRLEVSGERATLPQSESGRYAETVA